MNDNNSSLYGVGQESSDILAKHWLWGEPIIGGEYVKGGRSKTIKVDKKRGNKIYI